MDQASEIEGIFEAQYFAGYCQFASPRHIDNLPVLLTFPLYSGAKQQTDYLTDEDLVRQSGFFS
jgi:hypothetical protein